jgi:NTP pyrophosphatase (non-canonical NTP hydrolase)
MDEEGLTEHKKFAITQGFDAYGQLAWGTAKYPGKGTGNLYYPALGLGGEAGEVLEKIKKLLRDMDGKPTDEFRAALTKELGDVLWYINALCAEAGLQIGDVAVANIEKLFDRRARGVLHGSGDNR